MSDPDNDALVYLLDEGVPVAELRHADFERHIERQTPIPGAPPGVGICRAAYVEVAGGPSGGLLITGLAFFLLPLDAKGRPSERFGVPLEYLVKNAGPGPDFGHGRVPMACRGQCPVPWHANDLWDPAERSSTDPATVLAATVARNALGLKLAHVKRNPDTRPAASAAPRTRPAEALAGLAEASAGLADAAARRTRAAPRSAPASPDAGSSANAPTAGSGDSERRLLAIKVEQMVRDHAQTLLDLQNAHEQALREQQSGYEGQIQLYKQEVTRLKAQVGRLLANAADDAGRSQRLAP